MSNAWPGEERRGDLPGRRFYDSHTCPFHKEQHESVKALWCKQEGYATKHEVEVMGDRVKGKLDKWVFALFVSSITVLVVLAGSIFGYVAVEALQNSRNVAVIQVNQNRLLKYFDIPAVVDPAKAEEILGNGDNKSE